MRELSLDDIEALAVGAWVLGTGGGGKSTCRCSTCARSIATAIACSSWMPPTLPTTTGWARSPTWARLVGQERLTDSLTLARAVSLMERHIGRRFAALMSMEIGGANGVRPFMAAAHLNRPVVDSDDGQGLSGGADDVGRGRWARPYPLTAVDVRGFESIVHKVPTWKWTERVARKICVEYGSVAKPPASRRAPAPRSRMGHPRHHDQGHRHRPGGARGSAQAR